MRKSIAIITLIILTLTIVAVSSAAELKLTKFTVTPSSFNKGQTLSFSLEIENPTDANLTGLPDIYMYVKDGTPEREGPGSFLGRTPTPTIAPRAKMTINLSPTYRVPLNAGNKITFTVHLPAITPGVEFGPSFQYSYNAVCTYKPELKLKPLGVIKQRLPTR